MRTGYLVIGSGYLMLRFADYVEIRPALKADGYPLARAFRLAKEAAGWKNDELRLPEVPA